MNRPPGSPTVPRPKAATAWANRPPAVCRADFSYQSMDKVTSEEAVKVNPESASVNARIRVPFPAKTPPAQPYPFGVRVTVNVLFSIIPPEELTRMSPFR